MLFGFWTRPSCITMAACFHSCPCDAEHLQCSSAWKRHGNRSKAVDLHQTIWMVPVKDAQDAPLEEAPIRWRGDLWSQKLISPSAQQRRHFIGQNLCTPRSRSWIWACRLFQEMKLLAVLALLQRNLDPLLPLGPFYPPLPTRLRGNTAALYHFSWITLFSALHCSLLLALLRGRTLIKAPALKKSISKRNISIQQFCWPP